MPVILISLFIILIFFSIIADYKYNKIFNYITFGGILGALLANLYLQGVTGITNSLMGLFLGMAIFFPLFCFRLLGAGDVKLVGAMGALFGPRIVFSASIYIILVGAIMSVVILIYKRRCFKMLKHSFWGPLYPTPSQVEFRVASDKYMPESSLCLANCRWKLHSSIF